MNKKAFFFVETQFDNLGDALLNRELFKLISLHAQLELGISKVPSSFFTMIGSNELPKYVLDEKYGRTMFLLKVLFQQILNRNCYVFLSPGGWIGELDGNRNLRSSLHSFIYKLLSLFGVKICQLGVSYEDIGPKLKKLLQVRSSSLYCHYVRDKESLTFLHEAGVAVNGISPDLAFNLFTKPDPSAERIKAVTFSFRADQSNEQMSYVKTLIHHLYDYFGSEYKYQFVAQVGKDVEVNRELASWFVGEFHQDAKFYDAHSSIDVVMDCYRRTGYVFSNRLHSLLLAGSVDNVMIPAPIMECNQKIIALFSDSGLNSSIVYSDSLVNENLKKDISTAVSFQPDLSGNRSELERTMALIFSDEVNNA